MKDEITPGIVLRQILLTVVDGCSLLGVTSLIGHFVTVKPNGKDENAIQRFSEELESIK